MESSRGWNHPQGKRGTEKEQFGKIPSEAGREKGRVLLGHPSISGELTGVPNVREGELGTPSHAVGGTIALLRSINSAASGYGSSDVCAVSQQSVDGVDKGHVLDHLAMHVVTGLYGDSSVGSGEGGGVIPTVGSDYTIFCPLLYAKVETSQMTGWYTACKF